MIPAHIRLCVCECDGREKKDYVNMYKIINRKVIKWDQLLKNGPYIILGAMSIAFVIYNLLFKSREILSPSDSRIGWTTRLDDVDDGFNPKRIKQKNLFG